MRNVLTIILLISSLIIIVSVLMKESKSDGVAALSGKTNIGEKGKRKTKDSYLNYVIVASGVIFLVSAILMSTSLVK